MADLKDYLAELKASTVGLGFQCHKDTYDAAIRALEKQIPEKPLEGIDINGNEFKICRKCSAIVSDGDWMAKYCPDCGQALDWGGEDDA